MGARGLHQRLRHRQHGGGARQDPATPARPRSATARRPSTSCSRATALRPPVRPDGRLLPGPRRERRLGPSRRASTRADWGGDYTETNGWNFAFHAPQDGTRPGQPLRRPRRAREEARHVLRDARRPRRPRRLRRHDPRDARGPRRPDGAARAEQPGHRTTSPTCTTTPAQPWKTPAKVREITAPPLRRRRDRPGLPGRRGQRRDVGVVPASSLGFYPLQVGCPNYAIGSPLFDQGDRPPRAVATSSSTRPATARSNIYVQSVTAQRPAVRQGVPAPRRPRARRDARVPHGPAAVALGHGTLRRAAVDHPRRPAARPLHDATDPHSGTVPADELFDDTSSHRGDRDAGAVRLRAAAPRDVLHADQRPRPVPIRARGRCRARPTEALDHAGRPPRRDVQVAHADAAVRGLAPGAYRHYRIALAAPARLAEVELLTRAATPAALLRASVDAGPAAPAPTCRSA